MSLFLQDWSVVSPIGVGKKTFIDALGKPIASGVGLDWSVKPERTLFDGFDKKFYLGKKGVRGMDGLGAYATVASHLIAQENNLLSEMDQARIGVVLGTGSGSLKSQIDFIRDLHEQERVEWVNPIQFPQTVMNCAAGQVSIWHGYTGANTTVSAGQHSGTAALEYSANLLRHGRADLVLAGCAEEHSNYSKYLFPDGPRRLRQAQRLGEGCTMFLVAGYRRTPADAEIFGFRRMAYLKRWKREQRVAYLSQYIDNCLKKRGTFERGISRICFNAYSDDEETFVDELREASSAAYAAKSICSNAVVGDCLSASNGIQLALLLTGREWVGVTDNVGLATDLAITFSSDGGVSITFLEHREKL